MKTEHTQTPWKYDAEENIIIWADAPEYEHDRICRMIAEEADKANAAHIVRCVNQHDALVAALKDAHGIIVTIANGMEPRHSDIVSSIETNRSLFCALQSPAPETK